jgi:hypothetical protein
LKRLYQDYEHEEGLPSGSEKPKLKVTIKYGSLESTCEGSADEVLKFVFRFIRDVYPDYEIVSGLTLSVDLEELLRRLKGVISFLPRGRHVILKPTGKLTDSDLILTHLVAAYAGNQMGMAEKGSLSMAELLEKTGKSAGTVAGRLSELAGNLCVDRVGRGEYKVTEYGVKKFMDDVLPILEEAK